MVSIRVLLADDHRLVRAGVRDLLSAGGLNVVAEAEDGRGLLRAAQDHGPDVAVVDVAMPGLDGIEASRRLRTVSPGTKVVLLTMHNDPRFMARSAAADVWGYVMKDQAADYLVDVVHRVAGGERCLPEAFPPAEALLTSREQEVLQLIIEGKKNADIARILCRSVHTVRAHRARLMRKLGVCSASDLLEAATRRGLVVPPVAKRGLR